MIHTPEWHARRRLGIGGSDAPAVIGISPYRTPYDVWVEKTSQEPIIEEDTFDQRRGRALEAFVLDEYQLQTGAHTEKSIEHKHPDHSWLRGEPDALAFFDHDSDTRWHVVEIKTARHSQGWGDPGSDEIPLPYLVQAHHYMMVTGFDVADVAVLIAGSDFRIYTVHADKTIHAQLFEKEAAFWRLVETRTPPPVTRVAEAARQWGKLARPGTVIATPEQLNLIELARAAQRSIKAFSDTVEQSKAQLMAALADKGDTLVDAEGNVIATWKLNNGTMGYTVEPKKPTRIFLLK
jgi:putative phage-type endonuclease